MNQDKIIKALLFDAMSKDEHLTFLSFSEQTVDSIDRNYSLEVNKFNGKVNIRLTPKKAVDKNAK